MAESQSSSVALPKSRSNSTSQASESSQTAADFIKEQLNLEAEAREALPYQFDTCTRDLGPLRQSLYSCLDCNPPPASSSDPYIPAAVCYACSISCHGEHELVELFSKRNFVCDCGTVRLLGKAPCNLRINQETGRKGGVTGEEPAQGNKYNQNFRNKFCGCEENYDPKQERGTMFQCLGLGTVADGGCGEDWWHPECLLGIPRKDFQEYVRKLKAKKRDPKANVIMRETSFTRMEEEVSGHLDSRRPSIVTSIAASIANGNGVDGNDITADAEDEDDEDEPLPPGFPAEDDFEHFLCYKCVEAHPWIKNYANAPGFLPPKFCDASLNPLDMPPEDAPPTNGTTYNDSKKRKAPDDDEDVTIASDTAPPKLQKSVDRAMNLSAVAEDTPATTLLAPNEPSTDTSICKLPFLSPISGPALRAPLSLFLQPNFRSFLCHCGKCFPLLAPHPQLLEEEDAYEPPISEAGSPSVGTGSILDRGEAAFNNMDRVRAIQGAMAYASLKDGLQAFFKPFAESGKAVGAEDIKAYFEKLRGDDKEIRETAVGSTKESKDKDADGSSGGDSRREQSGY